MHIDCVFLALVISGIKIMSGSRINQTNGFLLQKEGNQSKHFWYTVENGCDEVNQIIVNG